jgi:hypothetical protein
MDRKAGRIRKGWSHRRQYRQFVHTTDLFFGGEITPYAQINLMLRRRVLDAPPLFLATHLIGCLCVCPASVADFIGRVDLL